MLRHVRYQIATYSGTVSVNANPDDENETIIAMARAQLRRRFGHFPFGVESWRVLDTNEASDE